MKPRPMSIAHSSEVTVSSIVPLEGCGGLLRVVECKVAEALRPHRWGEGEDECKGTVLEVL